MVYALDKRITITVDEATHNHFLKDIKGQMLLKGIGEISFSSYVNICITACPLSLEQIIAEAKKRRRYGDHWSESHNKHWLR